MPITYQVYRRQNSHSKVYLDLGEIFNMKWAANARRIGLCSGLYNNIIGGHIKLSWWLVTYIKTSVDDRAENTAEPRMSLKSIL